MSESSIIKLKSQFFLYRACSYAGFLLIPVWLQKSMELNRGFHIIIMSFYQIFMLGQWFLLGKEIDHRLKIYFRVNSSMDRVIYRLVLGMVFMILYFSLLILLPEDVVKHFFWGTWVCLGLFYSWPTRGKIIQESVSTQLGEFKFLDGFEKTVLSLAMFLFVISIPAFPNLETTEALKLYFDPLEKISPVFWNFLSMNYFPFKKFPEILRLAWCLHFYIIGMGVYLVTFYAFLRFFVSRRLSILGVFALISSWSYSKMLGHNISISITSTFTILWIWSMLWVSKSSTYRTGLFLGLMGYLGTLINLYYFLLIPIQIAALYFLFLEEKTRWYRRQVIKYCLFGFALSLATFLGGLDNLSFDNSLQLGQLYSEFRRLVDRKAFYVISILGVLILVLRGFLSEAKRKVWLSLNETKIKQFYFSLAVIFVFSLSFDKNLFLNFSLMWLLVFLSLLPMEWIFQSLSRLRSKRNLFYLIYILICLLDSHIEGRIKILIKLFQ